MNRLTRARKAAAQVARMNPVLSRAYFNTAEEWHQFSEDITDKIIETYLETLEEDAYGS